MKNSAKIKWNEKSALKSFWTGVALSVVTVLAVACGGKSPTSEYKDLGPVMPKAELPPPAPPTPTPTPTPPPPKPTPLISELPVGVFGRPQIISMERLENGKVRETEFTEPVFREGQKRTYYIKTTVLIPNVEAILVPKNLPKGMIFEMARPGYYRMEWTPKRGTLSRQEIEGRQYKFTFSYQVTKVNGSQKLKELVKRVDGKEIVPGYSVRLLMDNTTPEVLSVKKASEQIFFGDRNEVIVTVRDPGAINGRMPLLNYRDETLSQKDLSVVKLANHVRFDNGTEKDGFWIFKGLIDTGSVRIPENDKQVVPGRFVLWIVGGSGIKSAEQTVTVLLEKKPIPQPVPEPQPAPAVDADQASSAAAPAMPSAPVDTISPVDPSVPVVPTVNPNPVADPATGMSQRYWNSLMKGMKR